jgi:hypothetical protein
MNRADRDWAARVRKLEGTLCGTCKSDGKEVRFELRKETEESVLRIGHKRRTFVHKITYLACPNCHYVCMIDSGQSQAEKRVRDEMFREMLTDITPSSLREVRDGVSKMLKSFKPPHRRDVLDHFAAWLTDPKFWR